MTTSPAAFPDIELVVIDWLKNAASPPWTIVDRFPPNGFDGTAASVFVSRMGGVWIDDQYLDTPIVQLECYGPTKATATAVALAARAQLLGIEGFADGGGTVTKIDEMDGPRWLPDYLHAGANRYIHTVKLSLRLA